MADEQHPADYPGSQDAPGVVPERRAARPDPFALTDEAVEQSLLTGENAGLLEDYFGTGQYQELRRLARDAAARGVRGGERVLILPGIMGSKLGYRIGASIFDDMVWADPVDIATGRLARLTLGPKADPDVRPIGLFLFAYLKLKLRLRLAGYDAAFHPFDWRRSIVQLGEELARRIDGEGRPVHLVCHSMGGLVARAALLANPQRLGRIITLGTPHFGSFSPIQAFRGAHPTLSWVQSLDVMHGPEWYAQELLGTFPGLCEMIPAPGRASADFFDLAHWPSGLRPPKAMLDAAKQAQASLPMHYDGLTQIIGVNRETVVDAKPDSSEFVYTTSLAGDGTVPVQLAQLPDVGTYFVEESHGSLPNNKLVAEAVSSILATGETSRLERSWAPSRAAPMRRIAESALRQPPVDGAPSRMLSVREQRYLLDSFASPAETAAPAEAQTPAAMAAAASPGAPIEPHFSERIVVGRRRQRRIDLTLVHGSITDVEASAYVLGIFRNVQLAGAATVIDAALDGAVSQLLERRMFNAAVGEVTILPTGRHLIRSDFVTFAGLGPADMFNDAVLEAVGENLVRTFLATRVDNFATVPMGGSVDGSAAQQVRSLLRGFFKGLSGDTAHRFRGITICETDPARFTALRRAVYDLCATPLFDDLEVTLEERAIASRDAGAMAVRDVSVTGPEPVYLMVRQEADPSEDLTFIASVLTAGARATVWRDRISLSRQALDDQLGFIETDAFNFASMAEFGERLGALVLPDSIRKILSAHREHPLVVVHDAASSRIPWETIAVDGHFFARGGGVAHRYEADDLSVAKWLEERRHDATLDILLIVNPTRDLPGAQEEGRRIQELFGDARNVRLRVIEGQAARRDELLRCFSSGEFDIVHYAGHAYFDRQNPSRSGILCAGNEVLSGADLASVGNLPSLVFFNACEAARIRKQRSADSRNDALAIPNRVRRSVSFAEAFLRGGVANYLGTYWPVGDAPAKAFAEIFYGSLLAGEPLGRAILAGREAVYGQQSVDWADYIFYGQPDFTLKAATQSR